MTAATRTAEQSETQVANQVERQDVQDGETLLDARTKFFVQMGFAADGGYGDKWVKLKMGPIPFAIPNSPSRVEAVRFHDLHHVLTGYETTWVGEFEISAWEIATGCADKSFAWMINLQGMCGGMLRWPMRTFRAFVRGLRSRNLYREPFDDALLGASVKKTRDALGLDVDGTNATGSETARFFAWATIAWCTTLIPVALVVAGVGALGFALMG